MLEGLYLLQATVAQRTMALRTGISAPSASKTANLDLSAVTGLSLCKGTTQKSCGGCPRCQARKAFITIWALWLKASNVKTRYSFRKATVILWLCHLKKMDPDPFPPQPQTSWLILGMSPGLWPDCPLMNQADNISGFPMKKTKPHT